MLEDEGGRSRWKSPCGRPGGRWHQTEGNASPLTILNKETKMPVLKVGTVGLWRDPSPCLFPKPKGDRLRVSGVGEKEEMGDTLGKGQTLAP